MVSSATPLFALLDIRATTAVAIIIRVILNLLLRCLEHVEDLQNFHLINIGHGLLYDSLLQLLDQSLKALNVP